MAPISYQEINTYNITPGGNASFVEKILVPTLGGGGGGLTTVFPIIKRVGAIEKSSGSEKDYYYFFNSSEKVMFITDQTGYETYIGYAEA